MMKNTQYLPKDKNSSSLLLNHDKNNMNDLLFTALTIATLYYFFYYLPQQKHLEPIKLTQSTQTDPLSDENEKLLASTLDEIIKQIKQLNQILK